MVELLRPLVSFFEIVDDNLSNKSSNQHELKRLGVSEGGHLVADAVSVHEHEGARHLSTGPTSLLDFFSLPCDLGGYLLRRRSGLGGHHPGLVTFATHDLSPALEFWCRRRLESHDLGRLPTHRATMLRQWAALAEPTFPAGAPRAMPQNWQSLWPSCRPG